ncbi:MAG: large conductance mechanosensitive channel protein MscL [Actinomycetota bacterium]
MLKEFKEFVSRGNLVELAVAVVLGLAFAAVVNSLVADVITPLIAAIFGEPDFSAITIPIGDSEILIGNFLNALISFLIVTFVLFLVIKAYNRTFTKQDEEQGSTEIELLTQIRDELRLR